MLSAEGKEHIATHKYVAGVYTPLDLLLNPFWFRLAEALPKWLAPNLVTLLGFMPLVVMYALAWSAAPGIDLAPPRWLAFLFSAGMYFYQTMDALDGKQARRTGSSSPLGQLFDHGCDCLCCMAQHAGGSMVLLPGASFIGLASLVAGQNCFFIAQWQEYHTGVLETSFGPVGVTETQFTLIAVALTAAFAGPELLQATVTAKMDVPWSSTPLARGDVFNLCWITFCSVLGSIVFLKTVVNVLRQKGVGGMLGALAQLVPVLVMNVAGYLWEPSFYASAPREVCLFTGLLFFYYTAKIILFSMAKMPYPPVQATLLLYVATVALSWTPGPSYAVLLAMIAATTCWVFIWLHAVIMELTERLGIYAFSLEKRVDAGTKSQ